MKLSNIPTIRELLDAAPAKHDDRTFIKFIRDGAIIEKRFSEVRSDSLAFCRRLRDLLPEKTHVAIISKSSYAYIVCMTGVIVSGNVAVPVAPDAAVEDGDVLSVRGWGKYRIDSVNAVTRRGRNRVVARKYT